MCLNFMNQIHTNIYCKTRIIHIPKKKKKKNRKTTEQTNVVKQLTMQLLN